MQNPSDRTAEQVIEPRFAPGVLLYDRSVTPASSALAEDRLADCRRYAEGRGWRVGDVFVDHGDDALADEGRPGWDGLYDLVRDRCRRVQRTRVLVHGWDRLSHGIKARDLMLSAVARKTGTVHTVTGGRYPEPVPRDELCMVCGELTAKPVRIGMVETLSGPSVPGYACADHAGARLGTDGAWQAYLDHEIECADCQSAYCPYALLLLRVQRGQPRRSRVR